MRKEITNRNEETNFKRNVGGCDNGLFDGLRLSGATEENDDPSMFVCVETTDYWIIVYHKETKVMYAVNRNIFNSAGCGVFSPLYNADGTLQVYKGGEPK